MSAAERWATLLGDWALPDHVLDQAPRSPWVHDTATFVVDDTLDRDVVSATVARTVLPPTGGSVLDVGCGGGRAAMSLVPPAERVIGVDRSPDMLAAFTAAAGRAGARSTAIQGEWPDVAIDAPVADVVTCHHVVYDVAEIDTFLMALTAHARLAVVLVLPPRHPMSAWNEAWSHFWGIDRPDGPIDDDLVAVLDELGLDAERWTMPRPPLARHADDPDALVPSTLRRLCLDDDRADEVADHLARHPPDWPSTHTVLRWPGEAPS